MPQGSVLGPPFCFIFVKDFPEIIETNVIQWLLIVTAIYLVNGSKQINYYLI